MMQRYALMLLIAVAMTADAFMPASHQQQRAAFAPSTTTTPTTKTTIAMAGFGSAKKDASSKKKKKEKKLKPRQQWDRYTDLKSSEAIRVAVRVTESSAPPAADADTDEWFIIGTVKSRDDAHTEAAVIRHRVLMAEHARRMFPLKILANDELEWGYTTMQGEDLLDESWVVAGKVENMPDDIERLIGFQGYADPTGFYSFDKSAALIDNTAAGYQNMKNKGITGHCGFEIHD